MTFYAIGLHANVSWDSARSRGPRQPAFPPLAPHQPGRAGQELAGLFPFWDVLFGTYYMPKAARPGFGVAGEPVPSLLGQLDPLRR